MLPRQAYSLGKQSFQILITSVDLIGETLQEEPMCMLQCRRFPFQPAYLGQRPACLENAPRNAGGQAAVQRECSRRISAEGLQISYGSRAAAHCMQVSAATTTMICLRISWIHPFRCLPAPAV